MTAEQLIATLRSEIKFARRHVDSLQTSDFEEVDEIQMSLNAMSDALYEFELEQQEPCEEIPADVRLPEAA